MGVTIEQMNIVIARFDERKFYGKFTIDDYGPNTCNAYPVMKYHESWDWIVPVCRKIEQMGYIVEVTFNIAGMCTIWNQNGVKGSGEDNDPLAAVNYACYQFIQWYKQKEVNNER